MAFLPDNLNASNDGGYFKPQKNQPNRVRIISTEPLVGKIAWSQENKPHRWRLDEPTPQANWREGEKAKVFVAVGVYNYETQSVQVWEITQKALKESLDLISRDADFGHPHNYDLKITRRGDGLETTYSMVPIPGALLPEVQNAIENGQPNLEALLTNDDPFRES